MSQRDLWLTKLVSGAGVWIQRLACRLGDTYPHQPIFGLIIPSTINMKPTQDFPPRFKGEIELNRPAAACRGTPGVP